METVYRYELPKLHRLFVMRGSLLGCVTRSTALDARGKSLSSALLNLTCRQLFGAQYLRRHSKRPI